MIESGENLNAKLFICSGKEDDSFVFDYYEYNNKYDLYVTDHKAYNGFKFIYCGCPSFFLNFTCKHCVALTNLIVVKIKGYI